MKEARKWGGVPPYVPFSTFRNFLDGISAKPPSRIDQSVMPRSSRAIRFQLAAALRYMGLVSSDGSRTETLVGLAKAREEKRKEVLGDIVRAAYPYLFRDFDLATCTTSQIGQEFKRRGASGTTVRKCVAFFVAACREAGIDVSPHIKPFWGAGVGVQSSPNSPEMTEPFTGSPNLGIPAHGSTGQDPQDWRTSLLTKFPNFDPAWPDGIKAKWFEDFGKLMEYIAGGPKTP
jgi:hypothetical protein